MFVYPTVLKLRFYGWVVILVSIKFIEENLLKFAVLYEGRCDKKLVVGTGVKYSEIYIEIVISCAISKYYSFINIEPNKTFK